MKIIRDSKKKLISNLRRTNHHYLLHSRDASPEKDLHNANAHYDAIVLKKKNNDGDDSVFQLPVDDDILRPSQLFTPARPQLHPDLAKNNVTEDNIFHMDMTVFRGMAGKRVGVQLYDINGNVMYTVKCKKNQWHAKQIDGCYWATTTGKSKKLRKIGIRKVSRCKGDLVCKCKAQSRHALLGYSFCNTAAHT